MLIAVAEATLVAGTVTVTVRRIPSDASVQLTRRVAGGVTGELTYSISPGASITINSASAADTSTVRYAAFV